MGKDTVIPDINEMMIAARGSWLCDIFQKHKLTADERAFIINKLIKNFMQGKKDSGQRT